MNAHTPPPEGGSNSALSAKDRKVLLLHYAGEQIDFDEQIEAIREKRKKLRRQAKADGFDLGTELDLAVKIARSEDDEIIANKLAKQLQVAAYYNLPVNQQLDLPLDSAKGKDAAYEEGAMAGYLAKNREAPYEAKTDEHELWMRGYDDAQKQSAEVMQRVMDQRNAADPDAPKLVKGKTDGEEEEDVRPRFKQNGDDDAFSEEG